MQTISPQRSRDERQCATAAGAGAAFWASVGAASVAHGYDLYWTKIGPAAFTVEVGSVRGEELLVMKESDVLGVLGSKPELRSAA